MHLEPGKPEGTEFDDPHRKETLMKRILLLLAIVSVAGVGAGQAQATRTDAKSAPENAKEVRGAFSEGGSMSEQTNNLYLLEDLDDANKTKQLTKDDLTALRTVADWIKSFIVRPHKDLGRDGAVCPFVPDALEKKILWLAPEHIADRSAPEVVQLMSRYKKQFLQTQPLNGEDANSKVIVVVFTDFPADRAESTFGDVLNQLAIPSYKEDGILFGPFYQGNKGTAIYNSSFRPFQSPAPFLFVRQGVISDWKFFLDNDELLNLWARRYGEAGTRALAEELRRLPWRTKRN